MKQPHLKSEKFFVTLANRLGKVGSWQRAINSTKSMIGYLNKIPILLLGRSGRMWILGFLAFARFVRRLLRHNGWRGLAITLKVSQILIVKKVAGSPIKGVASSLGHRVAVTRSGLPKWIPSAIRVKILNNDRNVIQVWLTLCSLYRVLEYRGFPKLQTITSEGRKYNHAPYFNFVSVFMHLLKSRGWLPVFEPKWEPVLVTKAGPGSVNPEAKNQPPVKFHNSTVAMIIQTCTWNSEEFKELRSVFKRLALLWGQESLDHYLELVYSFGNIKSFRPWIPKTLGKLGIKEEPGKVRVFAMVDWWTQMLLRPLHLYIFRVLKNIPSDCTFDQSRGVSLGVDMIKKTGFAASYDLSAATDRLPVLVQSYLVDAISPGAGSLWMKLLVGRDYSLPSKLRSWGIKLPKAVRYEVGQPMGALSSWAMLALTHHFIVQFAAWRAGYRRWFNSYLVLGDDIVIFDNSVAKNYLAVMRDLGVDINMVKSVVSEHSFEFAKRFVSRGVDLSPISLKEMDLAGASIEGAILLHSKFARETGKISSLARFRGWGYKAIGSINKRLEDLPRRLRNFVVFVTLPGYTPVSWKRYIDWFGMTSLGHTKTPNLQSIRDMFYQCILDADSRLPAGVVFDRKANSSRTAGTDVSSIRWRWDMWGGLNLEMLSDWRIDALKSTLARIFSPWQKNNWQLVAENKQLLDGLLDLLPPVDSEDETERFVRGYYHWEADLESLFNETSMALYKPLDPGRNLVSRWLRRWESTSTSARKSRVTGTRVTGVLSSKRVGKLLSRRDLRDEDL